MAKSTETYLERLIQRRSLRHWAKAVRQAETLDFPALRDLRSRAKQTQRHLNQLISLADNRLMLPVIGSNAIRKFPGSDWVYRPELWRVALDRPGQAAVASKTKIGDEAMVFHDCTVSELTLRQIRNSGEGDLAPFGVHMDVFRFDGSFLSIVIDLPPAASNGLKRRHIVRLDAKVEMEKPLEIFARLNIRHGPNTEQIVRELPLLADEVHVEFDLAYTKLNEKRVDKMWVDLIFEGTEMNRIVLRDMVLSRRPRAEL